MPRIKPPKHLQLRNMPQDVNDTLVELQAEKLQKKKVIVSKENLIYQIVREWKKAKSLS